MAVGKKFSLITGAPNLVPNQTTPLAYSPVFGITGGAMSGQAHQSCWSQDAYFMDLVISFTGGTTTGTITAFTAQLPLNPATGTPFTIGGPTGARYMGGGVDAFALLTNRFDGTVQGVQGDTTVTLSLDNGNAFAAAGAGRSLRMMIRLPIAEFVNTAYVVQGAGVSATLPSLVKGGYDEYDSPSTACIGAITAATTYKATRSGRNVNVTVDAVTGTATAASNFTLKPDLPASMRPTKAFRMPVQIGDNGGTSSTAGMLDVSTAGVMRVFRDLSATGTFTNAAVAGLLSGISFSFSQ